VRVAGNRLDLSNRVAWVVGAAGALGRASALALARAGARVALSGRDAGNLEHLAAVIEPAGAAAAFPVDVRSTESVEAAAGRIRSTLGAIDLLVNATTLPLFGDPLTLDDSTWEAVFETKQLGYVRTMRAVLPEMILQARGAIVNLSGRGGRQPIGVHLPGGSANAAVNLLTKGFADRFGQHGIRINAVAPGPIASPRLDALQIAGGGIAPAAAAQGSPDDIAEAVVFLLSDQARFINGTVLAVDGGSLATV
jgi:3-oxoacyl-[acyl-carrier protein] reductase